MNISDLKRRAQGAMFLNEGSEGNSNGGGGSVGNGMGNSTGGSNGFGNDGGGWGANGAYGAAPGYSGQASDSQLANDQLGLSAVSDETGPAGTYSDGLPGWATTFLGTLASMITKGIVSREKAISMAQEKLGPQFSPGGVVNGDQSSGFTSPSNTGNAGKSGGSAGPSSTISTKPVSVTDSLADGMNLTDAGGDWADYQKNTLPGLQTLVSQAASRGNEAYDLSKTQQSNSMGLADQMNKDYTNIYQPFGKKMADEVNNLNSEGYLSQQRGKAMADVQQQADAGLATNQRNMMRMGVNPSSGRMVAMGNQNAIQTATAKAGAASLSDSSNKQNYLQGLNSMNNFGTQLQTQARANTSQGMDLSKAGLASGLTGLASGMDVSKLTTATAGTYGGLANQKASIANGTAQVANQQDQYTNSRNLNVAGTIIGAGLSSFLS